MYNNNRNNYNPYYGDTRSGIDNLSNRFSQQNSNPFHGDTRSGIDNLSNRFSQQNSNPFHGDTRNGIDNLSNRFSPQGNNRTNPYQYNIPYGKYYTNYSHQREHQ